MMPGIQTPAAAAARRFAAAPRAFLRPDTVLARFAEASGATIDELAGRAATREISRLRQEAAWLMRRLSTASLADIGRLLGGRDMKTIDEAIDVVTVRSARDSHYRDHLARLEERVVAGFGSPVDDATLKAMLRGLLADPALSDADARRAALALLKGGLDAA